MGRTERPGYTSYGLTGPRVSPRSAAVDTMSDLDQKIAKLPTWARDHIHWLKIRSDSAVGEAAKARKALSKAQDVAKRYSDANAALMELLGKAGQAGLDWAATVVSVLEGYEIFRQPEPADATEEWTAEDIIRNEG